MAYLVYKHGAYHGVFAINGRKKWIKIGQVDKKQARQILKQLEEKVAKDRLNLLETKPILLFEFVDKYLEYSKTNKAKQTHRREIIFCRHFKEFVKNILLTKINAQIIESYKAKRVNDGLMPRGINRELAVIRFMLQKAVDWGYLQANPFKGVKMLKASISPPKLLSLQEIHALISTANGWLKPMIITLLNTGVRVGEMLNLKWADVDFDRICITVRSSKTNNYRILPINQPLYQTLICLKDNYVNPNTLEVLPRQTNQMEYVFCLPDGCNIQSIKNSFNRCCRKASVKTTIHTLRHSFASYLVMNGVDLVSVKELLGHTQISTTMVYSHLSSQHKANSINQLPWARPKLEVVK